ncbi:MAG: argininosuccinate lyase [Thioalkalivibrio sp.]|nr:argininosuccinate lyase [Thioalkalivibrio sp.]
MPPDPAAPSDANPAAKLWGGRFSEATDAFVEAFTASVGFDRRLYAQDIAGSIAHATMLAEVGVLTHAEADAITAGLDEIRAEIEAGAFAWSVAREDVHMNIEARLIEKIGETGKKLHTGRSRNDQVATDIRLWLRDAIDGLIAQVRQYQHGLLDLAEREYATVMPGFTHLQTAQPVTFGHHMLAWYEMLDRDAERLADCRRRVNRLPLGAAALAGTSYPLDRELTARLLGFEGICRNSLDAVSDRDFAIEFTSCAALIMMHLSRQAEELILWTSAQFAFIDLPDRYCTGSSIMPQKKNPDVPELVRGKTGRVYGHLMSLLTLMKGQPLAYNKDNQEDKEPLFDTVDTLAGSLRAFGDMVPSLRTKASNMLASTKKGFSTATDLADYLVGRGLPFRDAHEVVGRAVRLADERECDLAELPLADLQGFDARIGEDVYDLLTPEGSADARNLPGGTAPAQVLARVAEARAALARGEASSG